MGKIDAIRRGCLGGENGIPSGRVFPRGTGWNEENSRLLFPTNRAGNHRKQMWRAPAGGRYPLKIVALGDGEKEHQKVWLRNCL
jgi:hypothetical protein